MALFIYLIVSAGNFKLLLIPWAVIAVRVSIYVHVVAFAVIVVFGDGLVDNSPALLCLAAAIVLALVFQQANKFVARRQNA